MKTLSLGDKGIPHVTLHDGRTIRYPDPLVKVNDSVMLDLETGKIKDVAKFDNGNLAMVSGGKNRGRIGIIASREKHRGAFDIITIKDAAGNEFATRADNVFVIGQGAKPLVSLPKGKGVRLTIVQEQQQRM